ncbi:GNAT family N-acetyltransferase [Mycolicibacterium sp. Dal123E01]|uniref:GNAT family N-acetyltransferase n=1 Tax=Mycolicibacterium sp. Dal123E01 TaxID=3457578 RepID=UPI00403E5925
MTTDQAELVSTWQYDAQWSVYNLDSAQSLIADLACYHAVVADERLIGFCCTGTAARVPGMTEDSSILDIGVGMEPALTGQGHGAAFGDAVLRYLSTHRPGQTLRAVVQQWNARSLALARRLGFADTGELTTTQGGRPATYRVLIKSPKL